MKNKNIKRDKKLIKKIVNSSLKDETMENVLIKLSAKEQSDVRFLSSLKILNKEKNKIFPNKDLYHKLLQKTTVTDRSTERYITRGEEKGRDFITNFNNFFMTFNWKVMTAVSMVVVLGGVFVYWQTSPVVNSPTIDQNSQDLIQEQEEIDLSVYTPTTVVAIEDINLITDSIINDALNEMAILDQEEMDIYLADAESQSLSDLEQLYEAYEL